jgi:hypothetical protein
MRILTFLAAAFLGEAVFFGAAAFLGAAAFFAGGFAGEGGAAAAGTASTFSTFLGASFLGAVFFGAVFFGAVFFTAGFLGEAAFFGATFFAGDAFFAGICSIQTKNSSNHIAQFVTRNADAVSTLCSVMQSCGKTKGIYIVFGVLGCVQNVEFDFVFVFEEF